MNKKSLMGLNINIKRGDKVSGLSKQAIELVNELHTERLSYDEYSILIDALLKLQEYEENEVVN